MDIIGEIDGIMIVDDYAHNPEKVMAVINAAKLGCKRVIAIFQPHGYSPTIFMKEEFINAFINILSPRDVLFMPEIYYAGGTASKNISSADIIKRVKESGKNAFFIEKETISSLRSKNMPKQVTASLSWALATIPSLNSAKISCILYKISSFLHVLLTGQT